MSGRIAATVIHYRSRSTVREVGKALGLSEDVTARLANTTWGSYENDLEEERYGEAGLSIANPRSPGSRPWSSGCSNSRATCRSMSAATC